MDMQTLLLLVVGGVAGGMLTALVGGAAVATVPALIAAGIPPLQAVTCNLTVAVPGAFLAALSDRKQLPAFTATTWKCVWPRVFAWRYWF